MKKPTDNTFYIIHLKDCELEKSTFTKETDLYFQVGNFKYHKNGVLYQCVTDLNLALKYLESHTNREIDNHNKEVTRLKSNLKKTLKQFKKK